MSAGDWHASYDNAMWDILQEAKRARGKFAPFNSSHEGYAVILEELDEMWDEIKANDIPRSVEEAVQVGAMALRYVAEMAGIAMAGIAK